MGEVILKAHASMWQAHISVESIYMGKSLASLRFTCLHYLVLSVIGELLALDAVSLSKRNIYSVVIYRDVRQAYIPVEIKPDKNLNSSSVGHMIEIANKKVVARK